MQFFHRAPMSRIPISPQSEKPKTSTFIDNSEVSRAFFYLNASTSLNSSKTAPFDLNSDSVYIRFISSVNDSHVNRFRPSVSNFVVCGRAYGILTNKTCLGKITPAYLLAQPPSRLYTRNTS